MQCSPALPHLSRRSSSVIACDSSVVAVAGPGFDAAWAQCSDSATSALPSVTRAWMTLNATTPWPLLFSSSHACDSSAADSAWASVVWPGWRGSTQSRRNMDCQHAT